MQYMGGKSRIAKKIREHLVSHGATKYVEPFVGGGAVLTAMARDFETIVAADAHTDLIDMYRAIQDGWTPPDVVTEEDYQRLKGEDPSPLRTFAAFGASFGGKEWGGYARNGRGDNYARQTGNSLARSAKAGMFDPHITFWAGSVFDLPMPEDLSDTVIYCDPPYAGTTGYRTGEFDSATAWDMYREWASRGAHVYVSEYSGPEEFLAAEFTPQSSLKEASSDRVTEKLFYIPPTREDGMRYMGGKSRIAKKIREHLVSHGATKYVEPFVGGGAVLTVVARDFQTIVAADAHTDLIDMYRAIQDGWTPPDVVTEEDYQRLKGEDPSPLRTFAAFGASFGGKEWGGYARCRSGRNYARQTGNSLARSAKAGMFDPHITFWAGSVFDLPMPEDLSDTVIYCDPPYAGTTGYRTGEFDSATAWDMYREWASRGAHVYVSEYSGPEEFLAAEFTPQSSLKEASSDRVTEKLFYIPPTREDGMTKPNPFRPEAAEAPAAPELEVPKLTGTGSQITGEPLSRPAPGVGSLNIHQLPRVEVPDHQAYYPHISAWLATGQPARDAVDILPAGAVVAVDTETMGLGADSFTLKCFTAAWETADGTVSVLLDPTRRDDDRDAVREILERAGTIVIQNAAFDVPPLYQNGLMGLAQISKVHDTVIYARMAYPDPIVNKSLESLATKLVGFPDAEVTMAQLFTANGLTTAEGFRAFDIDKPIYRLGAMADTVATLRLLPQIQAATWSRLAEGHPFGEFGLDSDGAVAVMEREQQVNRIMLRRSARGLQVDTDYLATYEETHAAELTAATDAIQNAGLDPDAGNLGFLLVTKLEERGELPADWPRTDSGRLRATKDDLPKLDHPLAASVRKVAELTKVTGYLTKVQDMVRVTGRVHPQVGILKASATGRMAYSWPELQQFPADARPIIVSESGLTSVDWSQIEPVVMANCAKDWGFLEPFEAGGDLYAPIVEAAGVTRKVAKVLLLAAMYGQGRNSMAAALGISTEEAQRLQAGMFSAMPTTRGFTDRLRQIGEDHGLIITADGRVLPIPRANGQTLAYKAVNYFCQGSAYSVLADTIVRLERAGLGDSIHLALHDELVVDTEAAEAVAEIMRTPPEFLQKWTGGRVPVFKTDANDMGTKWAYV